MFSREIPPFLCLSTGGGGGPPTSQREPAQTSSMSRIGRVGRPRMIRPVAVASASAKPDQGKGRDAIMTRRLAGRGDGRQSGEGIVMEEVVTRTGIEPVFQP